MAHEGSNPLGGFRRFRCSEIHEVPTGPGLYSWYGLASAGRGDWELRLNGDQDLGAINSRNFLKRHTSRHAAPSLDVEARGGFSTRWQGEVRAVSADDLLRTLDGALEAGTPAEDDERPAPKLQATLDAPKLREALFGVLDRASPVFSAPLYIGVATSLRTRIEQHTKQLLALWDRRSSSAEDLEKETRDRVRKTFAYRAVSRGFSPDSVEVWTLDLAEIGPEGLSLEDRRIVAEACEWLLNRWHRPALGRR